MSVVEGTADQTTAAMWDTSDEDYSDMESDGSEPDMVEDSGLDGDMSTTEGLSPEDDLVPMEGAPTE